MELSAPAFQGPGQGVQRDQWVMKELWVLHVVVRRVCSSESSRAELWPTASDGVRSAKVARAKLVVGRGGLSLPYRHRSHGAP